MNDSEVDAGHSQSSRSRGRIRQVAAATAPQNGLRRRRSLNRGALKRMQSGAEDSCSNGDPVQFPPSTRSHFCFGNCAEASAIVTRIESQPVLKGAPKGIGTFESDR